MEEVILFLFSFFFILLIYQMFIVRRARERVSKRTGKKKKKVEPIEVTYLVHKYKLDIEKVNYRYLLQVVAFTSSFDIALIVSFILFLENFILEIIGGFLFTLGIILLSYHIVYLIYRKKGMIKNES